MEAEAETSATVDQEYPGVPSDAFIGTDRTRFLEDIALWDACQEPLPALDRSTPVVLAIDAGESSDTFATGLVSAHPTRPGDLAVRYARAYVPEKGQPLNFDMIEDDIRDLVRRYAVIELAYDRFLMGQTVRRLKTATPTKPAITTVLYPFNQGGDRLDADKALENMIVQRRVAQDGNAQLRQHLDNADRKVDTESRKLRIVKRKHALKIDLAVMLSMACYRASIRFLIVSQPAQVGPTRPQYQQLKVRR